MNMPQYSECGTVATTGSSPVTEEPFDLGDLAAAPGSRHHRLLNSNETPLDPDSTIVNSVISKARASLALVEQELSRPRDRVKQLEEKRASLLTHLAKNTVILSPLRRIPPEVLGEIFLWTLPLVGALRAKDFDVADSPWVLTHVSRHWRAVSLSIPSLCSLFVVKSPEEPRPLPLVKAQIQRAQSLKIHFYGDQKSDSRPQIELFRCLAEHSAHWQELSIRLTSTGGKSQGSYTSTASGAVDGQFPRQLRQLSLFFVSPILVFGICRDAGSTGLNSFFFSSPPCPRFPPKLLYILFVYNYVK
ncbi:hypothetical protein C8R44DRAFT_944680 [Mycena epipterygia]|nr:hypothetical protein C8R44DRAFT_944680 [Mycena epipterygia]